MDGQSVSHGSSGSAIQIDDYIITGRDSKLYSDQIYIYILKIKSHSQSICISIRIVYKSIEQSFYKTNK